MPKLGNIYAFGMSAWYTSRTIRATTLCADAIESFPRDEAGEMYVTVHGRRERLAASRLYGHLFREMLWVTGVARRTPFPRR